MIAFRCPTCRKELRGEPGGRTGSAGDSLARPASFPFCSPRCKTIDLGAWLTESYRIPESGMDGTDSDDDAGDGAALGAYADEGWTA